MYAYEGKSIYQDCDLAKLHCHDFGFVFQAYNLIQEFSVEDNITLPLRFDEKIKTAKPSARWWRRSASRTN